MLNLDKLRITVNCNHMLNFINKQRHKTFLPTNPKDQSITQELISFTRAIAIYQTTNVI